jgi:hypothetical protein
MKVTKFTNTVITKSAKPKFKHNIHVELFLNLLDINTDPITKVLPFIKIIYIHYELFFKF